MMKRSDNYFVQKEKLKILFIKILFIKRLSALRPNSLRKLRAPLDENRRWENTISRFANAERYKRALEGGRW